MTSKTNKEHTYRVLFHNQGQIFEVYAKNIYQSDLYGFVEVEDYVFGNHSQLLIDPAGNCGPVGSPPGQMAIRHNVIPFIVAQGCNLTEPRRVDPHFLTQHY